MVDRSPLPGSVLLLVDRNYESYNNMAHLEEKGWKRLKKGDFKKKMKNGLTYQIWFDRSRYNYIDYEIGHGNV